MANPIIFADIVQDKSNWRKAYEDARNWAELMSGGVDLSKYMTPQAYIVNQFESDVCLVLAAAKPADLPDPGAAARDLYALFVKAFGEKEVAAAANTVLRAPKNSMGGLTPRADIEVGTYFASSPSPFQLFLTQVTKSSPRAYGIALALDQYSLMGRQAAATFATKEQWARALSIYDQLVAKYGEANTLAAAARLQKTIKAPTGGIRGDPKATSLVYWFQTLLKDPKAEIPDGQLPHFKAGSYDPHWQGKWVEVRGTVARVEFDKNGHPPYATIHFKESSNLGIMGFTPNSDMLQEKYGDNFAGLTGKPVEMWGEVNAWKEGGGVRIIDSSQLKVLDAATASVEIRDARPEWLTAPKPAGTNVDSPKYLAWKKFPPGTSVTLQTRVLHERAPNTDQYTRMDISRITMRLDSIDERHAVVLADSNITSRVGSRTQPATVKLVYQARQEADPPLDPSDFQTTQGEETLVINGKKIATRWESIARASDPMTFTKTWRSDEVPGGLVLEQKQTHSTITGGVYRDISETIYAPFDGIVPERGDEKPPIGETAGGGRRGMPPPSTPAPVPQPVAPAAPPATPPVTRGKPRAAAPVVPAAPVSPEAELARSYNLLVVRAARARAGLARFRGGQDAGGNRVPDDVNAAAARLQPQIQEVVAAIRTRDNALAGQKLQAADETLKIIEQFLAK
jgi:hypothetical protein